MLSSELPFQPSDGQKKAETARPRTSSPEAGVQLRAHTRQGANGRAVVWNVWGFISAPENA